MNEEQEESRFSVFLTFVNEFDIPNVKRMLYVSDYIDLRLPRRGYRSLEPLFEFLYIELDAIVLLRMLLAAGADPNTVDFNYMMHFGSQLNARDKLLVEAGLVDTSKLISASEFGYNRILQYRTFVVERTITVTFLLESRF